MPRFDKTKRYKNKKGQTFGKGVWLDNSGNIIYPGIGYEVNRKTRTISQYNSDGTITKYPWEDWAKKKVKEGELQVLKNDRAYGIPYIPEKKVQITINKNSPTRYNAGATFSENLLDSIATNAEKAGLPFSTAIGMVAKESTFGTGERRVGKTFLPWNRELNRDNSSLKQEARRISYQGVQSPSLLVSNWKQRNAVPFHDYFYDGQGQLLKEPKDSEFYDADINSARRKGNAYHLEEVSPLFHAFKDYRQDPYSYNYNDKTYPQKVQAHTSELINYSPEIQAYMKKHNLHSDGGELYYPKQWNDLSMAEKAEMIKVAVQNGITTLPEIREKYNEFAMGGYVPSDRIKDRITHYEGKAMTGAIDPLSGKYSKNNSFESEAKGFYNALPEDIRDQVLSNPELADSLYSYSYNVGAGNFKKRVVPTLRRYYQGNATVSDIEKSMWASGDSKLRGLQRRRAEERAGVRSALAGNNSIYPTVSSDSESLPFTPFYNEIFNTPLSSYNVPTVTLPIEEPLVQAAEDYAYSKEALDRQERQDRLNAFNMLLSMSNPNSSGNSLMDTVGMLTGRNFAQGGNSLMYKMPSDNEK